jgi:pimeloyl-ACP methyl ester carboxylesterase
MVFDGDNVKITIRGETSPHYVYDIDVDELNGRWAQAANVDEWTQFILKQTDDAVETITHAPSSGIWSIADGGGISYARRDTDWHTVRSQDEAFYLRIASEGQYRYPGADLTVAEAFIEGLAGTAEFKLAAPANPRTRHFARFAKVDDSVGEYQGREEDLILSFMNSRSKSRKFVSDDVTRYTESLKRDGGLRAAFMNYEAFDRDAAFLATTGTSALSKTPVLAVVCQSPFGNNLQRQLVAAGLKQTKAVTLDGCAHWIYEENPDETLAVLSEFLGTSRSGP